MRSEAAVLRLAETDRRAIVGLLARFGLVLRDVEPGQAIPGSWWGDSEAGLRRSELFARPDTPVHSLLHETCHFICMSPDRRCSLDTNAGGDYEEETAVCYLQVVLADEIPGMGRGRMMADMDAWGYSFRLGSAAAWFALDAEDAREWLLRRGLLDPAGRPTWCCRTDEVSATPAQAC